jgi:hypothetical protein
MCVVKKHAPSGKPIDIRSLRLWVTAHTPDPVIQVIDRDEQHI